MARTSSLSWVGHDAVGQCEWLRIAMEMSFFSACNTLYAVT